MSDRRETRGSEPACGRLESMPPVDPAPIELGRRIKLLRVSLGLTLKDLEQTGGISATHVSEIERGKASPTLGALKRIAQALGVRPAVLIEPRVLPFVTVGRAADRARTRVQWQGATIEPLAEPIETGSLKAQLLTLPISRGEALENRHDGEEWVMVLSGVAEIRVEGETFTLREGDALHFRGNRAHAYANPSSGPAVLLVATRTRQSACEARG